MNFESQQDTLKKQEIERKTNLGNIEHEIRQLEKKIIELENQIEEKNRLINVISFHNYYCFINKRKAT